MNPRTHVVDVVAQQMDGVKTDSGVDAILHCSVSSTTAAIQNKYPLPDFDEYVNV